MKGSILLPLVQILLIIIVSTLICTGTYLYIFNNSYGPEASLTIAAFISNLPGIMLNIFPIVVLISVILSLINTLKTPANRGLAALFTLIVASIIYYAGYTGLYMLDKISDPSPVPRTQHLYYGKFNPLVDSQLFVTELNEKVLAVEIKNSTHESSFSVHRNIKYLQNTHELISENMEKLTIEPDNPWFTAIFYPPELLKNLLEDLVIFNQSIKDIFEKSRVLFMLTILSQIAFSVGCWTVIRLSRWPFLNGLLAIAVIRLFPAYYRLSYSDLTQKAIGFLKTSSAPDLVPVAILLISALLLFLWDILFIKNKNSKMVNKNG
ncbi:MAG: hypothetical protein KAR21_17805 [Spirochaetales bacterium]|nr:hypothetical protein [Spirochaetales bacterium]